MSVILDKSKKYEKEKLKKLGNIKKNLRNQQEKTNDFTKSTVLTNSPRQRHFMLKNKIRNQRSTDNKYSRNVDNDLDDMNFLLSNENDPFSRSVIFPNNKKMQNKFFPSLKNKKNDVSNKKSGIKMFNNRNVDFGRRKMGMARSVKNSNIKANINNLHNGVSKFDEKYQLIEDKIIDKNYENDIDNDEMIIGNKKNNNMNALFNNVHINNTSLNNDNDNDLYFYFEKNNKNNNEDEYLTNNNFENNKNDFCIMYIDNYQRMINDDMLLLELQLLYEKILDLQNSYHQEYDKIINQYSKNRKFISLIIYKYKEIHKKNFNLLKIKEKISSKNKLNNFFNIQEKEHKSYISEINNKEINIWKNMLGNNIKRSSTNIDDKNEIKDLFKKIVYNKYAYIKNNLNDIENKIVLNLMKKHNYKTMPEKKNKSNLNVGTYTGKNKSKNNKIIKAKVNHKAIYSGGIYENKKNNFLKNNKFNNFINSSKKKGY